MFAEDIKELAKQNTNFRKVIITGGNAQVVLMSIPIGGEIGEETHLNTDQIIYIVDGDVQAILNDETKKVEEHALVYVPAGTKHNFKNIGDEELKLFTIYAPPHHPDGTIHATKEAAEKAEQE